MLGPLAIRVNQWYHINSKFEFRSPYHQGFTWERVVWAKCDLGRCKPLYLTEPFFEGYPEIIDIGDNCWCGIYAATDIWTAKPYAKEASCSAFVLVEALGTVMLHSEGFRASGVQILKVVDASNIFPQYNTEKARMTMLATAKNYGVGVIDWETAKKMIDYQLDQYLNTPDESEEQDESTTGL